MSNTVITIGRQFGSGGREIGVKLAERLGVPYYDKDILKRAAKDSGLAEKLFENFDEKPRSFLYSLVMDPYSIGAMPSPYRSIEQDVYFATFDAIKKVADEGSCVIIGRCADYALREYDSLLSVFIYAPIENRVERIKERYQLGDSDARSMIQKTDKQRAAYYNYYTSKRWGELDSYDVSINSALLGVDKTVDVLEKIAKAK